MGKKRGASQRGRQVLVCVHKRRFRGKEEALAALHKIQNRGDVRDRTPNRVYFCDPDDIWEDELDGDDVPGESQGCGGWHMTSQVR